MIIVCAALDCIHNSDGNCGVTEETQIDINYKGECLDYSPLSEKEKEELLGKRRISDAFIS